jgi:hypothetical protein
MPCHLAVVGIVARFVRRYKQADIFVRLKRKIAKIADLYLLKTSSGVYTTF